MKKHHRTSMHISVRRNVYLAVALSAATVTSFLVASSYQEPQANEFLRIGQQGPQYYVSPQGDDRNAGTLQEPFKTIEKARDTAKQRQEKGVTVNIRAGTYELTNSIAFGSSESGADGQVNTYQAYQDEQPIITGGQTVTHFTATGNNVYQAAITGISNVKDVYLNGVRLRPAQIPNYINPSAKFYNHADPWAGNFFYVDTSQGEGVTDMLKYKDADFNPSGWTTNLTAIEVVIYSQDLGLSITSVRKVQSIDQAQHTITLAPQNGARPIAAHEPYYIRNVKEELNAPGEYYVDGTTLLVYSNQVIGANDEVRIPIIDHLFTANGAHHLEFRDLTVQETRGAAFNLNATQAITVNNNTIRRTFREGVNASAEATNTLIVKNNHMSDIGASGVQIVTGDDTFSTQALKQLTNQGIVVQNNNIEAFGTQDDTAYGILSYATVGTLVTNNEVSHGPRMGIRTDGNDNITRRNRVHDIGEGAGSFDLAAIKPSSGRNWLLRGNVVENNEIYHTGGYKGLEGDTKFPWFSYTVYSDDLGSGSKVDGNLEHDVARFNYLHGGRDNVVTGNIMAVGPHSETDQFPLTTDADSFWYSVNNTDNPAQNMWDQLNNMEANGYNKILYYQRYPELSSITGVIPPSDCRGGNAICSHTLNNNKFEENIIYAPSATSEFLWLKAGEALEEMKLSSDKNLVWANNHTIKSYESYGQYGGDAFTWDQWRALNVDGQRYDQNSVVADPLFIDPANGNYQLRPNSPALALGFEQIPQDKIGLKPITPEKPTVNDGGATTTHRTHLTASWQSSDFFGRVVGYQYRVLEGGTNGNVVLDWTAAGTDTSADIPLTLEVGKTYYIAVQAINDDLRMSEVGYSDGIETLLSASIPFPPQPYTWKAID